MQSMTVVASHVPSPGEQLAALYGLPCIVELKLQRRSGRLSCGGGAACLLRQYALRRHDAARTHCRVTRRCLPVLDPQPLMSCTHVLLSWVRSEGVQGPRQPWPRPRHSAERHTSCPADAWCSCSVHRKQHPDAGQRNARIARHGQRVLVGAGGAGNQVRRQGDAALVRVNRVRDGPAGSTTDIAGAMTSPNRLVLQCCDGDVPQEQIERRATQAS